MWKRSRIFHALCFTTHKTLKYDSDTTRKNVNNFLLRRFVYTFLRFIHSSKRNSMNFSNCSIPFFLVNRITPSVSEIKNFLKQTSNLQIHRLPNHRLLTFDPLRNHCRISPHCNPALLLSRTTPNVASRGASVASRARPSAPEAAPTPGRGGRVAPPTRDSPQFDGRDRRERAFCRIRVSPLFPRTLSQFIDIVGY